MGRPSRYALITLLVCACSSSSSSSNPADAGSAGDDTTGDASTSDGSGGDSASDAAFTCTDRTTPACQPTPVGPTGKQGGGLTILGRDVFWFQLDTSVNPNKETILRTSLDTGTTKDEMQDGSSVLNDGASVFAINDDCCAGNENILLNLDPSTDTWTQHDIGFPQMPDFDQALAFGGSVYVSLGRYTVLQFSTSTFMRVGGWQTQTDSILAIGSDGAKIFMVLQSTMNNTTRITRLDDITMGKTTDLVPAPAAPPLQWVGTFAVDDTSVYFPSDTKILRASKGAPSTMADVLVDLAPNSPTSLTTDATSLYWLDDVGLHAIAKSGGTPTLLAPVTKGNSVAQTSDYVVWTSAAGLTKLHK